MQLIAMAGLPGTGKSTLARALAGRVCGLVLDKDAVRAALFGQGRIDYTRAQDDHCVRVIHSTVEYLRARGRERFVLLDGRTYSRREQVRELADFAASREIRWCLIECTCADEIALGRLERDRLRSEHLAGNRSAGLYRELAGAAEAIVLDRLVIDTGRGTTAEHVTRSLAHLRELGWVLP